MRRGVKAFLPQRKVGGLRVFFFFLENNIFIVTFLLFSASNKSADFLFSEINFKSEYFAQFLNFYNGAENSLKGFSLGLRTFTLMLTNILIFRYSGT